MKTAYIVAGGTGGHINAALSMGEEFEDQFKIVYLTGTRYLDYQLFKDQNVIHLNSKPLRSTSPITLLKNLVLNFFVFLKLIFLFLKDRPAFVLGAGGYICGPSLLAAKLTGRKIFIIEQNAVVGLTNKLLANVSDLVFTNFKVTKGLEGVPAKKLKNLGNPIRRNIEFKNNVVGERTNVLVFGGSLGASQINDAISFILENDLAPLFNFKHQTGKGVTLKYPANETSKNYTQQEFISDMNSAYGWANIIIARAGASTISELRIVRKPSILIPFPKATDNHQHLNAVELASEKLFPCEVIDHQLNGKELADNILASLESLQSSQNTEISPPNMHERASLDIKKEILKCLG